MSYVTHWLPWDLTVNNYYFTLVTQQLENSGLPKPMELPHPFVKFIHVLVYSALNYISLSFSMPLCLHPRASIPTQVYTFFSQRCKASTCTCSQEVDERFSLSEITRSSMQVCHPYMYVYDIKFIVHILTWIHLFLRHCTTSQLCWRSIWQLETVFRTRYTTKYMYTLCVWYMYMYHTCGTSILVIKPTMN